MTRFALALFFTGQGFAQTLGEINLGDEICPKVEVKPVFENGCLKAGVSVTQDLPAEFYGTWSVVSILTDTNAPELFRMRSSDVWSFKRQGNYVTLSNPTTGATASITVNEVVGLTAVFSRTSDEDGIKETETVQITVEGDSFSGSDSIIMEHFRHGKKTYVDRVKYKVKGYKISGPVLKEIFAQ